MPSLAPHLHGSGAIQTFLGIDVGGTKIALAYGNAKGDLLGRVRFPTPGSGDGAKDLETVAARARELAAASGIDLAAVGGVGVSLPGPLDIDRGVLLNPPNMTGWDDLPVRDRLATALGLPVAIENDANAAVLAEARFGAARGASDVVYMTMSTGLGGGLLLGGRVHRGIHASAGEIGHIPVEWEGEPCACGMRGCLEAYVGGAAWSRRLGRVTPATSEVARLDGSATPRPEHVVEAARAGDAFALAEFERFNHYLAWGIVHVVYLLAPEVVVLGTIPTAAGEALCLGPVREKVRARLWSFLADGVRIEGKGCGDKLGDYAGLSVALEAFAAG